RRIGVPHLCHITPARNIPSIAKSGALLSLAERQAAPAHSWGGNLDLCREYVCLSEWPSWEILSNRFLTEEAVVFAFDPDWIPGLRAAIFCPYNSAATAARDYLEQVIPTTAALTAWQGAPRNKREILVPTSVPLTALTRIVFSDRVALERWWPGLRV